MSFPLLLSALMLAGATAPDHPARLPARFENGRIFATPEARDGQTLKLWVDTGGGGANGMYILTAGTVQRLHLDSHVLRKDGKPVEEDGMTIKLAELPAFKPGAGVPKPHGGHPMALVIPSFDLPGEPPSHVDGMLGAAYLVAFHRAWTFDYPDQRLILESSDWRHPANAHGTALGFPKDAHGHYTAGFARIGIRVDGQPLDMLLDTGATGFPTPAGVKAQGGNATMRATSFIVTSQLENWHARHPAWRVIERADRLPMKGKFMRAIEVPSVEIAGWNVGAVWFTERPDSNFHDEMSSEMDKRVEGAVGGDLFGHFVLTADYPHAMAWFGCVKDCRAAEVEK